MFCEETIRSIGPGKILRGDATENCCPAIDGLDSKRILYYAFAVYVRRVVPPVLEFISTEHNVMNISISLKRFRYFIESLEGVSWPHFKIVIVDWSWALIHSILIEWNATDIYTYIRRTCRYALYGEALPEKWTIIYNCSVHLLKRCSDKFYEFDKTFAAKGFVMDCIAFMVQCKNLDELDSIFEKMVTVLVTSYENRTSEVRDELKNLRLKGFEELTLEKDDSLSPTEAKIKF